jgi:hypothetical protein
MSARLDAIEARLEAATPGPWRASVDGPYQMRVAETDTMNVYASVNVEIDMQTDDAELIAHAPSDLALLLKLVRLYEEALGEYAKLPDGVYGSFSARAREALAKGAEMEGEA